MLILLTGFGRFPGAPKNPSASIVAEVEKRAARRLARIDLDIATAVLPVEFDKIEAALAKAIGAGKPDAILHLGLAGRRSALTVEVKAKNKISPLHPDAARRRSSKTHVALGDSASRRARLPVARIAAAMRRTGAATRISHDAGDYVCNAVLYHSLRSLLPLAGFIHVPWPRRADRPLSRGCGRPLRPSHESMVRAATAALVLVGAELRRLRNLTGPEMKAKPPG
ncbi:MAG TPA: pyroglutamyl-peptidase I [Beijerinckiaceae bacterium]|nr:pyroglutamyl-peptidase I [Beijerinckiaceae bacterium]